MKRSIITTKDGSKTIRLEEWNEHYHSTHGAIQEAMHVYISAGLDFYSAQHQPAEITVLEAGFGTGLNAILSYQWAKKHSIDLNYIGLEAYPISEEERQAMDYTINIEGENIEDVFNKLHSCEWERWTEISKTFSLKKHCMLFSDLALNSVADVVFYDAFGPRVQPELWEVAVFEKFYKALKPGGMLVTYSVKGTAKRALQSLGFKVDIIPGPPGKRHMMRAVKAS